MKFFFTIFPIILLLSLGCSQKKTKRENINSLLKQRSAEEIAQSKSSEKMLIEFRKTFKKETRATLSCHANDSEKGFDILFSAVFSKKESSLEFNEVQLNLNESSLEKENIIFTAFGEFISVGTIDTCDLEMQLSDDKKFALVKGKMGCLPQTKSDTQLTEEKETSTFNFKCRLNDNLVVLRRTTQFFSEFPNVRSAKIGYYQDLNSENEVQKWLQEIDLEEGHLTTDINSGIKALIEEGKRVQNLNHRVQLDVALRFINELKLKKQLKTFYTKVGSGKDENALSIKIYTIEKSEENDGYTIDLFYDFKQMNL